MKRIGIVVPELAGSGGLGTVAKFILDSIRASGRFDVSLVSLAMGYRDRCSTQVFRPDSWRGPKVEERRWGQYTYSHVGCWFSEFEFQRYRRRRILTDLLADCDLIQVVSGSPAAGLAVARIGKPVALQVATRAIVERRRATRRRGLAATWRRAMTTITNALDDRGMRAASAVLVENDWMHAYAQQACKDTKALVLHAPPGVDVEVFKPLSQRLLGEKAHRYILSVGRFDDPRKNIELLLEAYALLVKQMRDAPRLVLAGASAPSDKFFARLRELRLDERVDIRTAVPFEELLGLYRSAHCFALSSDEEGFGMVLVEAMGCGVPVVSTRSGGPDGIVSDGVDGFLVPIDDRVCMANRLADLCASDEKNCLMGRNARAKIEATYSAAKAAAAYIATYDFLLGDAR